MALPEQVIDSGRAAPWAAGTSPVALAPAAVPQHSFSGERRNRRRPIPPFFCALAVFLLSRTPVCFVNGGEPGETCCKELLFILPARRLLFQADVYADAAVVVPCCSPPTSLPPLGSSCCCSLGPGPARSCPLNFPLGPPPLANNSRACSSGGRWFCYGCCCPRLIPEGLLDCVQAVGPVLGTKHPAA